jgi:hypothetical protein
VYLQHEVDTHVPVHLGGAVNIFYVVLNFNFDDINGTIELTFWSLSFNQVIPTPTGKSSFCLLYLCSKAPDPTLTPRHQMHLYIHTGVAILSFNLHHALYSRLAHWQQSYCFWLSCLQAGRERKGVPYPRCPPRVACRVTREEGRRAVSLVELLVMSRISVISA